jgi:hypothetical protein
MMYDGTSGGALMIQIIIEKCGDSPVFKIPVSLLAQRNWLNIPLKILLRAFLRLIFTTELTSGCQ